MKYLNKNELNDIICLKFTIWFVLIKISCTYESQNCIMTFSNCFSSSKREILSNTSYIFFYKILSIHDIIIIILSYLACRGETSNELIM